MNEMENQSIVSFQIAGRAASCRPDTRHSQDGERSEQQDPARGDGRPARQHRVHRPGDPGADLYTMFHEASTIHIHTWKQPLLPAYYIFLQIISGFCLELHLSSWLIRVKSKRVKAL